MLRLTPCPPGNANPESHEAQMSNAVGIGPDGELYPLLSGTKSVDILQVKAVRHGVDLHDLTILGCGLEDGFQVYRYRLTLTGLQRSEEHTSELQSRLHLVCRLL